MAVSGVNVSVHTSSGAGANSCSSTTRIVTPRMNKPETTTTTTTFAIIDAEASVVLHPSLRSWTPAARVPPTQEHSGGTPWGVVHHHRNKEVRCECTFAPSSEPMGTVRMGAPCKLLCYRVAPVCVHETTNVFSV